MIKRLCYAVRRFGDWMFPLPDAQHLASASVAHAKQELFDLEALAELYEAEAQRARVSAGMLRSRIARLSGAADFNDTYPGV